MPLDFRRDDCHPWNRLDLSLVPCSRREMRQDEKKNSFVAFRHVERKRRSHDVKWLTNDWSIIATAGRFLNEFYVGGSVHGWRHKAVTVQLHRGSFMIGINGWRDNTLKKSYLRNFVTRRFYFVSTPIELFLPITFRIMAELFRSWKTRSFCSIKLRRYSKVQQWETQRYCCKCRFFEIEILVTLIQKKFTVNRVYLT